MVPVLSALRSQFAAFSAETMRLVEDAVPKYPVPETERAVDDAYGVVTALFPAVTSDVPLK